MSFVTTDLHFFNIFSPNLSSSLPRVMVYDPTCKLMLSDHDKNSHILSLLLHCTILLP